MFIIIKKLCRLKIVYIIDIKVYFDSALSSEFISYI
jgi:hypothetical protein